MQLSACRYWQVQVGADKERQEQNGAGRCKVGVGTLWKVGLVKYRQGSQILINAVRCMQVQLGTGRCSWVGVEVDAGRGWQIMVDKYRSSELQQVQGGICCRKCLQVGVGKCGDVQVSKSRCRWVYVGEAVSLAATTSTCLILPVPMCTYIHLPALANTYTCTYIYHFNRYLPASNCTYLYLIAPSFNYL